MKDMLSHKPRFNALWRVVTPVMLISVGYICLAVTNNLFFLVAIGVTPLAVWAIVYLFQRPQAALFLGLFLFLFPFGLRPVAIDLAYTAVMNGVIALGLVSWVYHATAENRALIWNRVFIFLVLYLLWASVTLLWAPDIVLARKKLVQWVLALTLLFLIIQQIKTLEDIDGLMRCALIVGWGLLLSGVGVIIFVGYEPGTRLQIFDMNENLVGVYATMSLPGAIWPVFRTSGARRTRYLRLSMVFIMGFMVLMLASGSRGSVASLAIILVSFWFWEPLRPWGKLGGVLAGIVLISAPVLLLAVSKRADEDWGNEFGARDIIWKASVEMIGDYPFTGAGVGNGPTALTPYIGALTTAFSDRDNLPSHNPFLEIGADTGVLGMALYIAAFVLAIRGFWSHRSRWNMHGGKYAVYYPIVIISSVGFFASFIKDGGMEIHPTYLLFLAFLIVPSLIERFGDASTAGEGSGP